MRLPRWLTPHVAAQLVALDEAHSVENRAESDAIVIHYDHDGAPAKVKVAPTYAFPLTNQ